MEIKSPVSGNFNTTRIRQIRVSDIVALYKNELGLDVRRYFHDLEQIDLMRCNDTGYRFYFPFHIFADDQFYQELQGFQQYYAEDKWEFRVASKSIPKEMHVLEIGSGGGFFLQRLMRQGTTKLSGLELNSAAVEASRNKGLPVIGSTIEQFAKENSEQFDVVCAFQVLEHIPNVRSFILACLSAVKTGGRLIFGVPNNNPYLYKHDFFHTLNLPPHHAGLWNKEAFSKLSQFFPLRMSSIHVEPLSDYKRWYMAQLTYLKDQKSILFDVLSHVPRPLYKAGLSLSRYFIEGRNILVELTKR